MGQLRTSEPEQHMEGIHQAKGQPGMGYQSQQDEEGNYTVEKCSMESQSPRKVRKESTLSGAGSAWHKVYQAECNEGDMHTRKWVMMGNLITYRRINQMSKYI